LFFLPDFLEEGVEHPDHGFDVCLQFLCWYTVLASCFALLKLLYGLQYLILCGLIAVDRQVIIGRLFVRWVLWNWSVQKLLEVLLLSVLLYLLSLNGPALLVLYRPL
jgi:hypothetical protein